MKSKSVFWLMRLGEEESRKKATGILETGNSRLGSSFTKTRAAKGIETPSLKKRTSLSGQKGKNLPTDALRPPLRKSPEFPVGVF